MLQEELNQTQLRERKEIQARQSLQLQFDAAQDSLSTLQNELDELRKSSKEEMKRVQEEHDQQMTAVEGQHTSTVSSLKKSHAESLASLQSKLTTSHSESLASVQSSLSKAHSEALVGAEAKHQAALEAVRVEERAQAEERLQGQLSFLRSEHSKAQSELTDSHASQLSHLQKRFDELQAASVRARDALSGQEAALAANVSTLEATVAELTAKNDELQRDLRAAKAELSDLTLRLSSLSSQLASSSADHASQLASLSSISSQWKSDAERGRAALDALRKSTKEDTEKLEERIRQLEREKKELEDQWKNHVCVGGGTNLISSTSTVTSSSSANPSVVSSVPARLGSPMFVLANASPEPAAVKPQSMITANKNLPYTASQLLELHAYGTYITQAVGSDADLKHLFPLDLLPLDVIPSPSPEPQSNGGPTLSREGYGLDLLRKLKDGLLLAKLINHVAPRTIDERVLNKRSDAAGGGQSLGWQAIVENLNVCITSAKSLGLTMRVPHDQSSVEIDGTTGSVKTQDGRRVSMISPEEAAENAAPELSPSPENYVGIELGPSQLLLMSADSTLESVDILLDFLFQLIKSRLVNALFGPEKKKLERVPLQMPILDAEQRRLMMLRTASIQPSADPTAMAAMAMPAPSGGKKGRMATMSKYATLSKALPSNLTSVEHKRFVTHFTTCVLKDFDAPGELACMSPDQLLLRWMNYHIMQHAGTKEGKEKSLHLIAHLSDLDVQSYAVVIGQIDTWRLEKGLIQDRSGCFDTECTSATALLDYLSSSLSVRHFHTSDSIATHHTRLNLLLTAVMFQKWPMMMEKEETKPQTQQDGSVSVAAGAVVGGPSSSVHSTRHAPKMSLSFETGHAGVPSGNSGSSTALPSLDGLTEEERESTLLKSWLNSSGIPHISINDLFTDIRSGLVLLRFIDYLSPGCVDWKVVEQQPGNKFKCVSNLNLFLQLSREHLQIKFVNVAGPDLYSESNQKFVLAVLWQLLRHHTIAKLNELRSRMTDANEHKEITDASILAWANQKVGTHVHALTQSNAAPVMSSFQDPNLRNSIFLLNLLDNLKPGCVSWEQVETGPATDQSMLLRNASLMISVARKLGAEVFALPSDIVSTNKKNIVLVIASLMAIEQAAEE